MKTLSKYLLIAGMSACLIGCEQEKTTPTTWCILIDMSGVREDLTTRQQYAANTEEVFLNVDEGDIVFAAMITESSATEPSFIVQHNFESFKPTSSNREKKKKERKKFVEDLKKAKNKLLKDLNEFVLNSDRITPTTDVLSAIHVAQNVFLKNDRPNKILLILSDMEQFSSDYKFPSENLNNERISQIIEIEREKARGIPDLNGVKVFVAGANSKDSDRFFRIKNFWLAYFDACNATLMKEDYGAQLISINKD